MSLVFRGSIVLRTVESRQLYMSRKKHANAIRIRAGYNTVQIYCEPAGLADPAAAKKRGPRGYYVHYTPKDKARSYDYVSYDYVSKVKF